jgi:hypothetical protein
MIARIVLGSGAKRQAFDLPRDRGTRMTVRNALIEQLNIRNSATSRRSRQQVRLERKERRNGR